MGQIGFVNDLDVQRLHGFLDFVLLVLLDKVGIDGLLNLGIILELKVGAHLVGGYAGILLDLIIRAVDLVLT